MSGVQPTPSRPDDQARRPSLSSGQQSALIVRYLAGEEIPSLAAAFDRDQSSVWAFLRRRKVPMRSRSDACRTYELNEAAFDEVTEASAYWVGFLMGDGCVTVRKPRKPGAPRQHCVSLALAEADGPHVEAFRSFLGGTHPIRAENNDRRGTGRAQLLHRYTATSKRLAERLIGYGVVPRKSAGAQVVGLQDDRHFWRGMVDSDGCVRTYARADGTAARLGLTGSRPLLLQFSAFLARRLGIDRAPAPGSGDVWVVTVHSRHAERLAHLLYDGATVCLPRKLADARALFDRRARIGAREAAPCSVPGCRGKRVHRGYCRAHHRLRPPV